MTMEKATYKLEDAAISKSTKIVLQKPTSQPLRCWKLINWIKNGKK